MQAIAHSSLLPLRIQPHHVWSTRVIFWLINWALWIIPATAEALADDMGADYQIPAQAIGAAGLVATFGVLLTLVLALHQAEGADLVTVVGLVSAAAYTLLGSAYYLHRRRFKL